VPATTATIKKKTKRQRRATRLILEAATAVALIIKYYSTKIFEII
jgi:hypothetical protein